MLFMPIGEKISKYDPIKNVSRIAIFTSVPNFVKQCITKEKAINHELVVA
jgi:hypothetical protein